MIELIKQSVFFNAKINKTINFYARTNKTNSFFNDKTNNTFIFAIMLFVEKKRMIIMKTLQIISLVKETLNPIVISKQSNHLLD